MKKVKECNQMKKIGKKHIVAMLMLLIAAVFSLTGCGGIMELFGGGKSFDASRYVKGCLDASTKGVFEDYIATTNETEEQAKKEYEEKLDSEVKSITGTVALDEKQQESWRAIFKDIYSKYKYEVGEAVKGDEMTFTVPVKTFRLKLFKTSFDEAQKKLEAEMEKMVKKKKTPSNDEIMKLYLDEMAKILEKKLKNPEYAEEETINVTIKVNHSTNEYEIDDASITSLFAALDDIDDIK